MILFFISILNPYAVSFCPSIGFENPLASLWFCDAITIFLLKCVDDCNCRVVIGYDEGTIMIKIGREVPVASMDNSGKIIWAKHNEIQTVNIKTVGADFEVS